MNRLQKKCFIATAGFHLLLLVISLVGPAFFNSKPKVDDSQVLNVIPANLIDAAFNSGVRNAQPPAPTSIVPPPPQPTPPAPRAVVSPPTFMQSLEKFFKPEPAKPVPDTTVGQQHKIQVNTQLVTRTVPKNSASHSQNDDSQQLRERALQNAIRNLKNNFTSATTVDMPGDSSVAYANYASVVKSIYEQAWMPPDNTASDDANAKVTVTIASDGTVISAQVISSSGDDSVDSSVQRTLDRVTFIAPFPEGTTDKQRTYTINFNLKAKRMLE
ncbi:MAG: TonB family protein [Verrucomicrobiota bacterium]|jgi:TonB family protein